MNATAQDRRTYRLGERTFVLDAGKAEAALAAKRVIDGRETHDVQPAAAAVRVGLRSLPDDEGQPLGARGHPDEQGHRAVARRRRRVSDVERWIIRMGIGYFSAAEGIVGDNIQHVVRELVTAPELKLVLGRHAHEENIHADSLLYMISSLGINPHECEAMFEDIPTIVAQERVRDRASPATSAAIST